MFWVAGASLSLLPPAPEGGELQEGAHLAEEVHLTPPLLLPGIPSVPPPATESYWKALSVATRFFILRAVEQELKKPNPVVFQ